MAEKEVNGIAGGLKNALERGDSLEKAKATFINAGYSKEEVDQAASHISAPAEARSAIKETEKEKTAQKTEEAKKTEGIQEKLLPVLKPKKKKRSFIKTLLITVAVIVFLLILNILRAMLGIKF